MVLRILFRSRSILVHWLILLTVNPTNRVREEDNQVNESENSHGSASRIETLHSHNTYYSGLVFINMGGVHEYQKGLYEGSRGIANL